MKVILSGGAGFVGRNLIRVMIDEGFKPEDITVIEKKSSKRHTVGRNALWSHTRKLTTRRYKGERQ